MNSPLDNTVGRKRRREKVRIDALTRYGGWPPKCACCGETILSFLTIDHMEGGGRQHRKRLGQGGGMIYHWLKKNNYPTGYQVLCWNCNSGRDANGGVCPHKYDKDAGPCF